ncbi:MAG: hypothetical protein AAF624_11490 [Bacteroidota bacterium]
MGQQQLLLLVLGIVIVGLAVASGIQAFEENRFRMEQDTMAEMATRVFGDIMAWKEKPAALGGGEDVSGLSGLTLMQLGYEETALLSHGQYAVRHPGIDYMTINNVGTTEPFLFIRGVSNSSFSRNVIGRFYFFGPEPACIGIRKGFVVSAGAGSAQWYWQDTKPERPDGCSW